MSDANHDAVRGSNYEAVQWECDCAVEVQWDASRLPGEKVFIPVQIIGTEITLGHA